VNCPALASVRTKSGRPESPVSSPAAAMPNALEAISAGHSRPGARIRAAKAMPLAYQTNALPSLPRGTCMQKTETMNMATPRPRAKAAPRRSLTSVRGSRLTDGGITARTHPRIE